MWDQLVAQLKEFFNQPVPVIISTLTVGLIYALVIFGKTSLGKKLYSQVLSRIGDIKKEIVSTHETVKNVEILAEDKINALTVAYEQKIQVLLSYVEFIENFLLQICEDLPNAKVKKDMLEYKNSIAEQKQKALEAIGMSYGYLKEIKDSKVKEEKLLVLLDEKAATLDTLIKEAQYVLNSKKEIENDGERKEEENTNTEETTI